MLNRQILVVGHRGSRGTHIENTLPAFEEALNAKADYVETDVQICADLVPVIFHDPAVSGRLLRAPNGEVVETPFPITSISSTELSKYTCDSYSNFRFIEQKLVKGSRVLLLKELLKWHKKNGMGLNLELKRYKHPLYQYIEENKFTKIIASYIKKYGNESKILVSSFDIKLVKAFIKNAPEIDTALLFNKDKKILKYAKGLGIKRAILYWRLVNPLMIEKLFNLGIKVGVYTVNKEKNWKRLISYGIDFIVTDYPRKLVSFLEKSKY